MLKADCKTLSILLLINIYGQLLIADPKKSNWQNEIEDIYVNLQKQFFIGDNPHWPELSFSDRPDRGAYYIDTSNVIKFEWYLYKVCRSLGSRKNAAITFVLGHELGHFFEKEQDAHPLGFVDHIAWEHTSSISELKADYYGVMASYLTGYQIDGLLSELLPAIYRIYTPQDRNNKYPPLKKRKGVVEELSKKINDFQVIFETAHKLLLIGAVEPAQICLQQLKNEIQFPEVLNNLATCRLVWSLEAYRILAMQQVNGFDLSKINYAFPFEMDPDSRLYQQKTKGVTITFSSIAELKVQLESQMTKAHQELIDCLKKQPHYFTALLNLSLFHLLDNPVYSKASIDSVSYYLNKVKNIVTSEEQLNTVSLVEGVLIHRKGDKRKSLYILDQIKNHALTPQVIKNLSAKNMKLINNISLPSVQSNSITINVGGPIKKIVSSQLNNTIQFQTNKLYWEKDYDYATFSFNGDYNIRVPKLNSIAQYLPFGINTTSFGVKRILKEPDQILFDRINYHYIYNGGVVLSFAIHSNNLTNWFIYRIPDY